MQVGCNWNFRLCVSYHHHSVLKNVSMPAHPCTKPLCDLNPISKLSYRIRTDWIALLHQHLLVENVNLMRAFSTFIIYVWIYACLHRRCIAKPDRISTDMQKEKMKRACRAHWKKWDDNSLYKKYLLIWQFFLNTHVCGWALKKYHRSTQWAYFTSDEK